MAGSFVRINKRRCAQSLLNRGSGKPYNKQFKSTPKPVYSQLPEICCKKFTRFRLNRLTEGIYIYSLSNMFFALVVLLTKAKIHIFIIKAKNYREPPWPPPLKPPPKPMEDLPPCPEERCFCSAAAFCAKAELIAREETERL